MSQRNRREIFSLLRDIQDKETEIRNTLSFVHTTHDLKKSQKHNVNQDLKELYAQLNQVHSLLDEYIEDLDSDSD